MRLIRAGYWSSAQGWGLALAAPALALAMTLTAAVPPLTSRPKLGPDGTSAAHHELNLAAANPAAVLAWAKANCFSGLELSTDAPRTQLEIILQVAATYDAESRRRGAADVCAEALAATASIIALESTPAITGERPLYKKVGSEKPNARRLVLGRS